jgi:polyisoprenoid-binding protein YceI
VLLGSALAFSSVALGAPTPVKLDPSKSSIAWVGKKVTGQHQGTVAIKGGEALIEGSTLVGGTFEVDLGTIKVTDITDPKDNLKLTDHLKSDDFFGASVHPVALLTITKATPIASAKAGEPNYEISGEVSIKGIKNSVTFPAVVSIADGKAEAKATFTLDRTKWNVRYGSGKFFENLGDRLIYDDFEVSLAVVGTVESAAS